MTKREMLEELRKFTTTERLALLMGVTYRGKCQADT